MKALAVVALAGCTTAPPPTKPAPPVPVPLVIPTQARTCTDAALGIERATKDLHPPEHDVIKPMRARCLEAAWPQPVIDCFTPVATPEDLTTCMSLLPEAQREPLLAEIHGTNVEDAEAIATIVQRLGALKVGILNCDKFVQAVATLMGCPGMLPAAKIQLGSETADFWSLPAEKLSIADRAKMAGACGESLAALEVHATELSCKL